MQKRAISSTEAGLRCVCPRCGKGKLFQGYLTIAPECEACGLSYSFADPADGPAFFVMSGVSIAVVAIWGVWAAMAQPPIWLQFAVLLPGLVIGCLVTLRPVKAWVVAEQYVRKAGHPEYENVGKHGEGGHYGGKRR